MTICNATRCEAEAGGRPYCPDHWLRWQREQVDPDNPRQCAEADCDRRHHANGLCTMHYLRKRKTGSTDKPDTRRFWTEAEQDALLAVKPLSPTAAAYCRVTHGVSKIELLAADLGRSAHSCRQQRRRLLLKKETEA